MHLLLFLVGTVCAVAGALIIATGFAKPLSLPLTDGILTSATLGIVGGFLLIGLGAAVVRLRRISDVLEAQPFPRMVMGHAESPPPGAPAANPTFPSPPGLRPPPPGMAPAPGSAKPAVPQGVAPDVTALPPAPDAPSAPGKDAGAAPEWPRVGAEDRIASLDLPPRDTPAGAVAAALDLSPPSAGEGNPAPAAEPEERRVLKSGVIEGMAYTLFSDGSVDADLPGGLAHFPSISAWRAHMREHV